jgi:transposase
LFFLPAYSPNFSPIEEAFSKVKGLMRRAEARTREALVEAMGKALGRPAGSSSTAATA